MEQRCPPPAAEAPPPELSPAEAARRAQEAVLQRLSPRVGASGRRAALPGLCAGAQARRRDHGGRGRRHRRAAPAAAPPRSHRRMPVRRGGGGFLAPPQLAGGPQPRAQSATCSRGAPAGPGT
ncbi:unnamed protein product, partial [Prorocentrum cordatum]